LRPNLALNFHAREFPCFCLAKPGIDATADARMNVHRGFVFFDIEVRTGIFANVLVEFRARKKFRRWWRRTAPNASSRQQIKPAAINARLDIHLPQ